MNLTYRPRQPFPPTCTIVSSLQSIIFLRLTTLVLYESCGKTYNNLAEIRTTSQSRKIWAMVQIGVHRRRILWRFSTRGKTNSSVDGNYKGMRMKRSKSDTGIFETGENVKYGVPSQKNLVCLGNP